MSRPMLTRCLGVALASVLAAPVAQARVATLRVARVATPAVQLAQVRLRLDWPEGAAGGDLQLWAARVDAPELGYHFRDVHWRCPLARTTGGGWRCAGPVAQGASAPLQLALVLDADGQHATLADDAARLQVVRATATPDQTVLVLTAVPLAWAQALLAQAWPGARLKAGRVDGQLRVQAPARAPLRVDGPLRVRGAGFENADASIVGEGLGADLQLDYRLAATQASAYLRGHLLGGEFLAGNTYVALPKDAVGIRIDADRQGHAGWTLPRMEWRDGSALRADASARLTPEGTLDALTVRARSDDMGPLKPRYLSGWMGLFGLGDVAMQGALQVDAQVRDGRLQAVDAVLARTTLRDPAGRFVFEGLRGDLRYSAAAPVASALEWEDGQLYGLTFGAARLPFSSAEGALRIPQPVQVPLMGGALGLRDVVIRPPQGDAGMEIDFGMQLAGIDFGKVSQALGLPAFKGVLGGDIPHARYAQDRIVFEGGLALQLFDGRVAFSSLALERPFGTAPSLSADIALQGLDLLRLTEVLGFGSITGRLDGRIDGLRLVDWTPVAFDARFATRAVAGVPQRISQRAVQDIGSVGGASFIQTLQGRVIGLFEDFGYRRIGIGCKLENEVCAMSGLHSAGNAFTIVEGAGVPRLQVVGYNRAVNWPTLVERLVAAGKGDVAPIIH